MDYVGLAKGRPVDLRLEEHRHRPRQLRFVLHLAVDGQSHWLIAVAAGGLDRGLGESVCQPPLHEGRYEGVLRSGAVEAFPCTESELVWSAVCRHGKGPRDRPFFIADQEEEIALQVVEDLARARH